MDMAGPTDHEWMVWTVDNTTVSVNWLGDVHTRAHVQVGSSHILVYVQVIPALLVIYPNKA